MSKRLPLAITIITLWMALGGQARTAECDFNSDDLCDTVDVDLLSNEVVLRSGQAPSDEKFDLNEDGVMDLADRDEWLMLAAVENGFGEPYLLGDASLDGSVDAQDLMMLGLNWQIVGGGVGYSGADFDMNDRVDARDLNLLAVNWQKRIAPAAPVSTVPEPAAVLLWLAAAGGIWHLMRRHPRKTICLLLVGAMMVCFVTDKQPHARRSEVSIDDTTLHNT